MFGFFGKPVCEIITEANGYVVTTDRDFYVGHGTFNTTNGRARYFFDYDDVGSNADQQLLSGITFNTFNGNPRVVMPLATIANFGSVSIGGQSYTSIYTRTYNSGARKFRYTSNGVLTPATRKIRQELPYHYTNTIQFNYDQNTTPTAASNNLRNSVVINGAKFPELRCLDFHETFVSAITFNIRNNPKCNVFQIRECAQLTSLVGSVPSTVTSFAFLGNTLITNINSLISGATGVEGFALGGYSGAASLAIPQSTLVGSLNLAHMVNMKEIYYPPNPSLTALNIPTGKTDWSWVHIQGLSTAASTGFSTTRIVEFLSSPDLRGFVFYNNGKIYNADIVDANISDDLLIFYSYGNTWTGNITLTSPHPTLREFRVGNNASHTVNQQLNDHSIVNITGLTQTRIIDLAGSEVDNLELPTNTLCTTLIIGGNNLSITTNPNLLSKINAMTGLTTLALGVSSNGAAVIGSGQASVDGFGSNPSFTGLTLLTSLLANNCKISGTVTLPTGNVLSALQLAGNTGLTSIVNLNKTSIGSLQLVNNTLLTGALSIGNSTAWSNLYLDNLGISSFNVSGRTSGAAITGFGVTNSPNLTTIQFPVNPSASHTYRNISINGNSALTTIPNFGKTIPIVNTGFGVFAAQSCALNITFPFGTGSTTECIWRTITIQNNGMSVGNVDATIDNIYQNRSKWNVWNGSHPKSMNISGTNASPTGTYQAPAGFVLGSNDGTPASAKEQLYVLVNNYNWTMTYT